MTTNNDNYPLSTAYGYSTALADKLLLLDELQLNEPTRPYGLFQQLHTGTVTCRPASDCAHPASDRRPSIELSGQWLAKAGFVNGTPFVVEVYRGMLIVVLEPASSG